MEIEYAKNQIENKQIFFIKPGTVFYGLIAGTPGIFLKTINSVVNLEDPASPGGSLLLSEYIDLVAFNYKELNAKLVVTLNKEDRESLTDYQEVWSGIVI